MQDVPVHGGPLHGQTLLYEVGGVAVFRYTETRSHLKRDPYLIDGGILKRVTGTRHIYRVVESRRFFRLRQEWVYFGSQEVSTAY